MDDEGEIFNGFGSAPLERNPSQSGRRTKKRWSFHNNNKPNLVDLLSSRGSGQRRMSDVTGVDGVHKEIDPYHISPAQLYSTESGRLFHAGKICIALAGLPGRGKTHLSVSLTRYLRWLGVKTHSFHLGDYRRASAVLDLHHELFMPEPEEREANQMRNRIVDECVNDMLNFFEKDKGQVAIYDAVNALPDERLKLSQRFSSANIQVLFIESTVTDYSLIMKNMELAARSSPDYVNWDYDTAYKDYSDRIKFLTPYYQEMGTKDADNSLSYIKFIDFGNRIELHNSNYGYLINKVVFFLMNLRIKLGLVFFARCYKNSLDFSHDPPLDEEGRQYAENVTNTLFKHLAAEGRSYAKKLTQTEEERPTMQREYSVEERQPAAGVDGVNEDSLVVWTSVKRRTVETTKFFREKGVNTRHRIQLSQMNPGSVGGMDEKEIEEKFPSEYALYKQDPYHHRFSRAELYHDLAIKIEPLILEMERMSGDILIIADETVLKVFYGYLMSCSCYDIPSLHFATDEIIEIRFNAYSNTARVIPIEDAKTR